MATDQKYSVELRSPNDDEKEHTDEWNTCLVIKRNGKLIDEHWDCGEPEDNSYSRDWGWIMEALIQAYSFGQNDGESAD